MKKNFLKKFLGVFLSALLVILPIVSSNVEKVKADNTNCETFNNYYFFLLVAGYNYNFNGGTYPAQLTHTSYFKTDLPENIDYETQSLKWLDLSASEEGWSVSKYWAYMRRLGALDSTGNVVKEGNNWYYSHIKAWYLEGGQELETYTDPFKYTDTENIKSTFTTTTTSGTNNALNLRNNGNATMSASIKRTIPSSWADLRNTEKDRKDSNGNHPTEGHMWLPGLLKVTYQANCKAADPEDPTPDDPTPDDPTPDDPTPSDTKYPLILHYLEDGTNKEISDPSLNSNPENKGTYKEGASYATTCPSIIGDYNKTREKDVTGVMPASEKHAYCYYKLKKEAPDNPIPENPSVPTYKVTVNYLDKNTKKPIRDPYTDPKAYENGSQYFESCPDGFDSVYILDGHNGNLTGTIAGKNVTIDCLYVKESAPTSDIPVYIVWGVGGAALAYSIYYFRKYYKEQNNA